MPVSDTNTSSTNAPSNPFSDTTTDYIPHTSSLSAYICANLFAHI